MTTQERLKTFEEQLSRGATVKQAARRLGVTAQSYYAAKKRMGQLATVRLAPPPIAPESDMRIFQILSGIRKLGPTTRAQLLEFARTL